MLAQNGTFRICHSERSHPVTLSEVKSLFIITCRNAVDMPLSETGDMKELQKKYKRNEDFVYRKIENETILVPIKDNVGDMGSIYNLNEVAAFIWEHLDGKKTLLDIKNMVLDEFQVSPEQAQADLREFVSQLKEINAILE